MDTKPLPQILLESRIVVTRSWWTIVTGICVGLSISLIALEHIPEVHRASTSISADTGKLPKEFVRPTASGENEVRLRTLTEAVLSPAKLRSVVVEVFGEAESVEKQERLVEALSSQVEVNYSPRTGIIEIGYRSSNPQRAANVTDSIANLFLEDNARFRTAEATAPTESPDSLVAGQLELGNPFEVVLAAPPRSRSDSPRAFLVMAVGGVAGLAIFMGPLLARRLLNPVVRSEARLRMVAGIDVLATVPIIPTPESMRALRRARLKNIGLSTLSLLALVAVVTLRYFDWV